MKKKYTINVDKWDLLNTMNLLGSNAFKYASRHNDAVELYGYRSIEASFAWWRFQTVCDCIRCYKGFDIDWKVSEKDTRKICEFYITYDGEMILSPWRLYI